MSIVRKILNITRPYWPRVAASIVFSFMVSGIAAAIAWAVKPALDEIFTKKQYEYLKFLPPGIFVLFTIKGLLDFGQSYLMQSAGMKLVREMRNKLYDHVLRLPISYFGKESSGIIISRIMYDTEILNGLMSNVIKSFVIEVPTILFLLGLAFYRKWDLTLMTLALLPFIAYSKSSSVRVSGKNGRRRRRSFPF